jgi:uncharacterized membrane protein (DUF485 family)
MIQVTPPTAAEAGSYAGAVVAIVASMTLTQWGILVGIFTALATFFLNAFYMRRREQREERLAAATLASLGAKP